MFSAEKKRIAFVIHRFHDDICGGAEQECMQYVEHLKNYFDIDVLTTTSSNDGTWENTYPEGIEVKNGYKIRRFPVTELKSLNFNLLPEFNSKCHSYTEELDKLLDNGPLSPELFFYVRENWNHYESIFFFTYCFFSCAFCSLKIPNAILIPTAHDEELFKFDHFTKLFNSVKGFLFQTEEEKKLVESKIGKVAVPYEICGVGIDALNCDALDSGLALETSNSQYLLYVGRICEGKGVPELLDFFKRYKKDSKSNLKLILIGKDYLNLHSDNDITVAGFVSEKERNSYMKAAEALVLPSRNESLSMVCLEAMSLGTPIIVSGFCDVLVSHVKKSDSGSFSYRNYEEFKKAVLNIENRKLSPDQRSYYANRARNYVKSNYSWEVIVSKITALVDKVAIENEQLITSKAIRKHDLLNSSCFIYCCKNEAEVQELSLAVNSLRLYGNIPQETELFMFH